jgi:hypothetical protein
MPHPPIAVPEVGKGEEKKIQNTLDAYDAVAKKITEKTPDTIILITPHGVMFEDSVSIFYEDNLVGDLKKFGVPQVSMNITIDKSLSEKIYEIAQKEGLSVSLTTKLLLNDYNASPELDHGAIVPLYFINKFYSKYKLVHITYAALSDDELYMIGTAVNKAVEEMDINAVFIASGELSHRLKADGPYGYNPYGEKFDIEFLRYLEKGDLKGVLSIDKETVYNAGECGRRSVVVLLGTLEGTRFEGKLFSYEGTFGVGYGVMEFIVINDVSDADISLENTVELDPYVRLARESLTYYLETGEMLKTFPEYVTQEMKKLKRGVFVSLKKSGDLRGCIGTIFPVTENVSEEIIRNAIEAGIYDPRFNEVTKDELKDIDFSVDVLTEPEVCKKEDLNPKEYGVIVRNMGRTGLLLPDLEGVDTVDEQLSIALRKGGINQSENYIIQRFEVIRHKES